MSISDPDDPADLVQLIGQGSKVDYRKDYNYDHGYLDPATPNINTVFSPTQTLTQDTYYYYEVYNTHTTGDAHLSLGMQVATSSSHFYPKVEKQVMELRIDKFETFDIKITNPDGGTFTITLTDDTGATFTSNDLSVGATGSVVQLAINAYFTTRFSRDVDVTAATVCYDS